MNLSLTDYTDLDVTQAGDVASTSVLFEDRADSAYQLQQHMFRERASVIEQQTGSLPHWYNQLYYATPTAHRQMVEGRLERGEEIPAGFEQIAQNIKRMRLLTAEHNLETDADLARRAPEVAADARSKSQRMSDIVYGTDAAGYYASQFGTFALDPVNLVSTMIPVGRVAQVSQGILSKVLTSAGYGAVANMATEAAIQPLVFEHKQNIGSPYTAGDAVTNVALAGVLGGVLAGSGTAALEGIAKAYRKAVKAGNVTPTPDTEAAARVAEDLARANVDNPLPDVQAHMQAVDLATRQIDEGLPVDVEAIVRRYDFSTEAEVKRGLDRATGLTPSPRAMTPQLADEIAVESVLGDLVAKINEDFSTGEVLTRGARSEIATEISDLRQTLHEIEQRSLDEYKPRVTATKARERVTLAKQLRQQEADEVKTAIGLLEQRISSDDAIRNQRRIPERIKQRGETIDEVLTALAKGEAEGVDVSRYALDRQRLSDYQGRQRIPDAVRGTAQPENVTARNPGADVPQSTRPVVSQPEINRMLNGFDEADNVLDEAEAILSRDEALHIPDAEGNAVSARAAIDELDDEAKALREAITCMTGGARG